MDQFIASILALGDFTKEDIDLILLKINTRHKVKNEFLLREGQICQSVFYLNRGSIRQYQINDRGEENTLNLLVERDWVLDYQSFTSQKPSRNNIRAFEACELFELSICSLHELLGHSQKFFMIGKLLENGLHPIFSNGHFSSPEEKYHAILTKKPQLLEKFPLTLIASYLGMAPETLSRVRRRIKNNSC